jgi:soluble lytic murein transglycosylase-like protein
VTLTPYRAEIEAISASFHLDPDVIEAIVLTESAGKTHAYRFEPFFWERYLSRKPKYDGAVPERVSSSYGLMQVMYPVACELGFTEPPEYLFVPIIGLQWGCRKFRSLLDWAKQDVEQALAAYNGGKGDNAQRPFRNKDYVTRVLRNLDRVKLAKTLAQGG